MSGQLIIQSGTERRRLTCEEVQALAEDGKVAVGDLLPPAGAATHVTFESVGGDYRASIPIHVVTDKGIVEVGERGSLRLQVVDGDTLCWNVKDVGTIRLTEGPEPDSVPENPPH